MFEERIILRREINETFKKAIMLRVDLALEQMELENEDLQILFCNSFNKHTCIVEKNNKKYVVFDEHHFEILRALNLLYFSYGKIDLLKPFYDLLFERYGYFKNLMNYIVTRIIAEKFLLRGDIQKALDYAEDLQKYITKVDDDIYNHFLIYSGKNYIAQTLCFNFYVYHELAHCKYTLRKKRTSPKIEILSDYIDIINSQLNPLFQIINKGIYNLKLNKEECVCDTYALWLLFEYLDKNSKENFDSYMLEAYIISITNIVLMDSIRENDTTKLDEWYVNAYYRIIIVITTLKYIWAKNREQILKYGEIMLWVREQYENYRDTFNCVWSKVILAHINNQNNNVQFGSEEWKNNLDKTLNILSKLDIF